MALTAQNWSRPKLAQAQTTALTPLAALADTGSDTAIVDIYSSINATNKVLARVKIQIVATATNFKLNIQSLMFDGNAANYSAGGAIPTDAVANAALISPVYSTPSIDLNAFYTAAGVVQSNT